MQALLKEKDKDYEDLHNACETDNKDYEVEIENLNTTLCTQQQGSTIKIKEFQDALAAQQTAFENMIQ